MMRSKNEPMLRPRRERLVFSEDQLRVLVSPIRKELLSAFLIHGPCGVAEVAQVLVRPTKSVYYHVRAMAAVGLIVEVGSRGKGRERESLFDAAADRYMLRKEKRDSAYRTLERQSVKATLRLATREFERAIDRDLATLVLRLSARLSDEDYEEVGRRLRELIDFVKSRDDAQNGRVFAITAVAAEGTWADKTKTAPSEDSEEAARPGI